MIVREGDRAWTFLRLRNILKNEEGTITHCWNEYIKTFSEIKEGNIFSIYLRKFLWLIIAPVLYILQIIDGSIRRLYVLLYIKMFSVRKFIEKLINDLEKKRR